MISNAERRFYLFGLFSAFCFLAGLVFIVWNVLTTSLVLLASGSFLTSISVPIMFIACESICYPDDYNRTDKKYPATRYSVGFYLISFACATASIILLVYIQNTGRTTTTVQLLFWGLFLTLCFAIIGRIAQKEPQPS